MGCKDLSAGNVAERGVILERRDICQACPHATRNPAPEFAGFKGLTSKSLCLANNQLVRSMTLMSCGVCPDNPPRWPSVNQQKSKERI